MITITHYEDDCVVVMENDNHAGIVLDCYTRGWEKPHSPMPSLIGEVLYLPDTKNGILEVIICDCDEAADPRLWIGIDYITGRIYDDHPHDSPNYR